jgi:hypothetical protein
MPKVAILIAASPTRAFFSQIAATSLALRKLRWSRWEPVIYAYMGGERDEAAFAEWLPHLRDVEIVRVSTSRSERDGDWAQCDDVFRLAPRDADVLLAMDADTLLVANLEQVLDDVVDKDAVAGVIAHSSPFPGSSTRDGWTRAAEGLIDVPLDFSFTHTLMSTELPHARRAAPFYLNFGVVFFPRVSFDNIARRYLAFRQELMTRMEDKSHFSGQVALTLAITAAGARTWELPMRFNFPNDPIAGRMYPEEEGNVAVYHYLRRTNFDRHRIFTSADEYSRFMALPLAGVDRAFQQTVARIIGTDYPFG